MNDWLAVYVIWLREVKRFWREKPRVITSVVQPILWLFILGIGIGSSLQPRGIEYNYIQYIFPGVIAMTILFSSMNSGIYIVWDREFGFLKEILVSPVSRASIVLGKILAGSTTAIFQSTIILLFASVIGINMSVFMFIKTVLIMILLAISLSTIGILIGSKIASFHSYPLVSNFIIMPMFFLSGAMFPLSNVPSWMHFISKFNPLTYGVDLLRQSIIGSGTYSVWLNIFILLLVAVIMGIAATYVLKHTE